MIYTVKGFGVVNKAEVAVIPHKKWSSHHSQKKKKKRVQNAVLGCNLKNDRMISAHFQSKPFNIMVIQVYALTSNTEEAEVEQFYEDLQDLLELTPKKDVLFIIGDWNAKVGEGNGAPLQYSCLETPMDGGAWWAAVHGVAKSRT